MNDEDPVNEGETSKTTVSSPPRRLLQWLRARSLKESILLGSAIVTIVGGPISLIAYVDEEYVLALRPSLPKDRGTHVSCIGHGIIEPSAHLPEISVSVVCERLLPDGFDAPETPAVRPEFCTDCPGVTAQYDVSCELLGKGKHEVRTKVRGTFQDDDGEHRADEVYSQPVMVNCRGPEAK